MVIQQKSFARRAIKPSAFRVVGGRMIKTIYLINPIWLIKKHGLLKIKMNTNYIRNKILHILKILNIVSLLKSFIL